MTDQSRATEIVVAVKEDMLSVSLEERLATMLLTTGILTFGFMLGAHFMAADLLFGTRLPPIPHRYQAVIETGVYISGGALVLGVALEHRRGDDQ